MRKDLIVICYVDDLGIQAPKKEIVDDMIKELKRLGFDLTLEGSFSEYLGIKYTKLSDTNMKMTQEGLIRKIMDATIGNINENRKVTKNSKQIITNPTPPTNTTLPMKTYAEVVKSKPKTRESLSSTK